MSDRRVLQSGNWVVLRPMIEVTERQRRKARLAIQRLSASARAALEGKSEQDLASAFTVQDSETMYELNDLVAVEQITSWSWDRPISSDSLLDLPGRDYEEILVLTAPGISGFFGMDFNPTPDPDSPTLPSDV